MSGAHIIPVRNVNQALVDGLQWLCVAGHTANSRNGPVLVAPGPVITAYRNPMERVLFSPVRDANPFFHLYECVWMMAGRNDAASVAHYAKNMLGFADPDGTLNGAYGYRWRHYFGYDQIDLIIQELKNNPNSRRCVLSMWDPGSMAEHPLQSEGTEGDLHKAMNGGPDVPCNTHVYFDAHQGKLDMTVCNRSNDLIWGAYGANAVHMSFLQEVVAACAGLSLGTYYQMSNNLHVYVESEVAQCLLVPRPIGGGYSMRSFAAEDLYENSLPPVQLAPRSYMDFVALCEEAAVDPCPQMGFGDEWFDNVFHPLMHAHSLYKVGYIANALAICATCTAPDWRVAGTQWLQRRLDKAGGSV